jgi:hypothetical protein
MASPENRKLVVRTPDGMYLSRGQQGLSFVNDIYGAVLLDPQEVEVEELLLKLRTLTGVLFEAVPLVMEEVFETCDQCAQLVIPLRVYFDGTVFLCPDCRKRRAQQP